MGSRKTGVTAAGGAVSSAKARTRWRELNDRQRACLEAVYRADGDEEAWQRSGWSRGGRAAPADEWRWILYGSPVVDETPLRIALKEKGLVDPGAGSTFAALAERGLLLTRHDTLAVPLGGRRVGCVEVLYARTTTEGRQAVRVRLAHAAPERLPAGTLREWHWRALARAYAAGDDGLAENPYSRGYGGIGQRTWDRLLRYKHGGRFGALAKERTVGGWGSLRERLFVTPDGIGFYRECWEEYRKWYPDVEAPSPE